MPCDGRQPVDARQRYSRAFKYADRVFLAALLMPCTLDEEFGDDKFHGFGIWELKPMPRDANTYLWEQVATYSEYDNEYREFFRSFSLFEIKVVDFKGFVCMTSSSICGKEVRKFPPLVYGIESKSWFLLPECKGVMDYRCVFGL
ncbi:hypothetical protein GOP47_0023929 [Adiantum capillus-veneris]|uniref:Uncharacterized protein n=1 Tax=Adiantum capillus-veneris TaxID=13818 RepID=A0A9D4U6K8_ADICA|nr:hypothetical protein GOP47_0023929 [Adiantum capillus-veneris]